MLDRDEIPYSQKVLPILPPGLIGENFLSCVNDYIEHIWRPLPYW